MAAVSGAAPRHGSSRKTRGMTRRGRPRDETAQATHGRHVQVEIARTRTLAGRARRATRGRALARMVPRAIHVPCGADGVRREKGKSECASGDPGAGAARVQVTRPRTGANAPPSEAPAGTRRARAHWSSQTPAKPATCLIEPAVRGAAASIARSLLRRATYPCTTSPRAAWPGSSGARRHWMEANTPAPCVASGSAENDRARAQSPISCSAFGKTRAERGK